VFAAAAAANPIDLVHLPTPLPCSTTPAMIQPPLPRPRRPRRRRGLSPPIGDGNRNAVVRVFERATTLWTDPRDESPPTLENFYVWLSVLGSTHRG